MRDISDNPCSGWFSALSYDKPRWEFHPGLWLFWCSVYWHNEYVSTLFLPITMTVIYSACRLSCSLTEQLVGFLACCEEETCCGDHNDTTSDGEEGCTHATGRWEICKSSIFKSVWIRRIFFIIN